MRVLFIGFSQARLHFRGALQITLLQRLSNQRVKLGDDDGLIEKRLKSFFCACINDTLCNRDGLDK